MDINQTHAYLQAQAVTLDQLLSYVSAVSTVQSELLGDYLIHKQEGYYVFVGYNIENPSDTSKLDSTIAQLFQNEEVREITVLAPIKPSCAPAHATSVEDYYYFINFPFALSQKVKNMLSRAHQHVYITKKNGHEAWSSEHQELMLSSITRKGLDANQSRIMQSIEKYILTSPDCELFSAYDKNTHSLLACALGDFSSFSTAFYSFAFRRESMNNIPGVADALLYALLNEAEERGYSRCNLGLGINKGIQFFKTKWGAVPELPCIQTSWKVQEEVQKKSWFQTFFQKNKKETI